LHQGTEKLSIESKKPLEDYAEGDRVLSKRTTVSEKDVYGELVMALVRAYPKQAFEPLSIEGYGDS
jgi:hypothetical protein